MAAGDLYVVTHCDAQEAFALLATASQRSNRELHDIAQSIVDGVTGPAGRRK